MAPHDMSDIGLQIWEALNTVSGDLYAHGGKLSNTDLRYINGQLTSMWGILQDVSHQRTAETGSTPSEDPLWSAIEGVGVRLYQSTNLLRGQPVPVWLWEIERAQLGQPSKMGLRTRLQALESGLRDLIELAVRVTAEDRIATTGD